MKAATKRTKGMVLRMIESVWGSLRSPQARAAWAKGQARRNKTDDQVFRHWIISQGVPEDIARRAWAKGSRAEAIKLLADNADWIKYYRLENEVKAAFKKHTPK